MSFNYIFKFNFIIFKLVSFSHVTKRGGGGAGNIFLGNCPNTQQDGYFLFPVPLTKTQRMDSIKSELELNGMLKKSFLDIFEWKISLSVYWKFQNGK